MPDVAYIPGPLQMHLNNRLVFRGQGTPSYHLLAVTSRKLFSLDRHNYFPMLPRAVGATFNASITYVRPQTGATCVAAATQKAL